LDRIVRRRSQKRFQKFGKVNPHRPNPARWQPKQP
jgi:hypothetical protein